MKPATFGAWTHAAVAGPAVFVMRLPSDMRNAVRWHVLVGRLVLNRVRLRAATRRLAHGMGRLGTIAAGSETVRDLREWDTEREAQHRVQQAEESIGHARSVAQTVRERLEKEQSRLAAQLAAHNTEQPRLNQAARRARQDARIAAVRQAVPVAAGTAGIETPVDDAADAAGRNLAAMAEARAEWRSIRRVLGRELADREETVAVAEDKHRGALRERDTARQSLGRAVYDAGRTDGMDGAEPVLQQVAKHVDDATRSTETVHGAREQLTGLGRPTLRAVCVLSVAVLALAVAVHHHPATKARAEEKAAVQELQERVQQERAFEELLPEAERDLLEDTGLQLE